MSDLVARLHEFAGHEPGTERPHKGTYGAYLAMECAAEIEQLTADRDRWRTAHDAQQAHYHAMREGATERVLRLEAALREIERESIDDISRVTARAVLGDGEG